MKSSFKKLPGSRVELEVNLEQKEFLPYYQAAYDEALKNIHLKGFRPGTAPRDIADAAVDKEKVFNEAAKEAIRWSLDEITKDNEWTLIDAPQVEVEDSKDLGITYKARFAVFPEIKLGNYKKIAKRVLAEKKEQIVEPKEIDEALDWIRKSRKTGEQLPEINDELAKSLGKFQNVDELRKSIGDGVKMEKEYKEQDRLRIKMMEEIVKDSEIDLPEVMVEKTHQGLNKQYAPALKAAGKSEEEIGKQLHERARSNVATNLVLYRIAQTEKLEPTPEEVEAREGREHFGQKLDERSHYQYIYGVIQNEKVFAFLESQK